MLADQEVIKQALAVARKAPEDRLPSGPVQLVQQNLQVNIQPQQQQPLASVVEEHIELRMAAAHLQNRQQNLELAECQFMEMLQQRVREVSNAENLNQQEMTQRVLHLEERLESDARSYAERCEVDVAGLQNFTRECENYVRQEQNVVRNCESHLNRLHHQVAEHASVNQRLESSMVLQTSQLELNEQMAQHALKTSHCCGCRNDS
jgi:hypothetical protein